MPEKILIAVGGTGGHVYPALALSKELRVLMPTLEILFAGGRLASNPYFKTHTQTCEDVACGTFSLKRPFQAIPQIVSIGQGVCQSHKILTKFCPDLVVGFGSFYTLPLLIAAKWAGVPIVLHEQNSIPGKVNRLFSGSAKMVGIQFASAAQRLRGTAVEVEIPLREGFKVRFDKKEEALYRYGLNSEKPCLLIFGGSQGAQALNQLVKELLCDPVHGLGVCLQVIHLAGNEEAAKHLQQSYEAAGVCACVKAFDDHMHMAWQAADFVICRAGAGTIAEACACEVPALLIPYPFAADNHQLHNAYFYADTIGGGKVIEQKDVKVAQLAEQMHSWLRNEGRLLKVMRQSIRDYKKKRRTPNFAVLIQELLSGEK